jgi:hypothetical protein
MAALVAFKDADFGTVFDRIGRAPNQMRIAAAFDAADRPNKFLLLDDEGTLLHSPAPNPDGAPNAADKRCGIRTTSVCVTKKLCKTPKWNRIETVLPPAARAEAECGQRVRRGTARGFKVMTYQRRRPADLELSPGNGGFVPRVGKDAAHTNISTIRRAVP